MINSQAREAVYVLESFSALLLSHSHMIKLSYRNRMEADRLHSWARSVRDLVEVVMIVTVGSCVVVIIECVRDW